MRYDYVVKYNGEYYAAGEEVPMSEPLYSPKEENEDIELPFSDVEIEMEMGDHKYTYDELEPMTAKEIRKLAEDKGIRLVKTLKDDIINEFVSKQ